MVQEDSQRGVITGEGFVMTYQMDTQIGVLTIALKDGEFNNQSFKEYRIGRGFAGINFEVVGNVVHLLLSNESSYKILSLIDTKTTEIEFFPINVNLGRIDSFKVIGSSLMLVQKLEKGDFVQLYHYRTGSLISIPDLYLPKTRIWDVQVKDGIFDLLVYREGNQHHQNLKMVGFDVTGGRVYDIDVAPPGESKFIFKSAKLISSPGSGYSIAGTYSKKHGEQFSGYYHIAINDFLEQSSKTFPLRSLEGFFDYKKNPQARKNAVNLRRDMVVYHAISNGSHIALAASSDKVVRKFVHFVLLDHGGEHVFDTSVKVFYDYGASLQHFSTLGLIGQNLYFIFEGNTKINVLPGYKLYQIENGTLTGLLQVQDYMDMKKAFVYWEEVKFYHWKDNKFIVAGLERVDGISRYVVRKIEV